MSLPDAAIEKLRKLAEEFGPPEDYGITLDDNDEPAEETDVSRQAEAFAEAESKGVSIRKVTDSLFDDATAPDVDSVPVEVRLTVVEGGKPEEEPEPEPEYLPEKLMVWANIGKWEGRHRTGEFSTGEPIPVLAKKGMGFGAAVEDALKIIIDKVRESDKPEEQPPTPEETASQVDG